MSNMRKLDAYLRSDFKDIIKDMNKITLFDFDYKTRGRIKKKLKKIYFEQNQRLIRRNNMKENLNYHSFQGIKGNEKDKEIKSIN
jgi:ABC-type multidrug transport system ATPase subunit